MITAVSWLMVLIKHARYGTSAGMFANWDDRFGDLYHYDETFGFFHSAEFFTYKERFAYPAPSAIVYDVLLHVGQHRVLFYLFLNLIVAALLAYYFAQAMTRLGTDRLPAATFAAVTLLTSWPFLFLLERGNIEFLVIGLTAAGFFAYLKGYGKIAAVCWGLAASMKIYPLLLFAALLYRRYAAAFLMGAFTFGASLLGSFWFVGPTIPAAARGTLNGIGGFVGSYVNQPRRGELNWDHSLLATLKAPLSLPHLHLNPDLALISKLYYLIAGLAALILYFGRMRKLPALSQLTALTLLMVFLPPVSYDYTLCHLYPAFAFYALAGIRAWQHGSSPVKLRALCLCFVALFTSQTWLTYHNAHLNGPIKVSAMFYIIYLLSSPSFGEMSVSSVPLAAPGLRVAAS